MRHLHKVSVLALLTSLVGCVSTVGAKPADQFSLKLIDQERQRPIPVKLYFPQKPNSCTSASPCPVAIISAGYGVSHKNYSFIALLLRDRGYLAVTVQHELPTDPPLATTGDLFALRTPNWQRGAENLRFVRNTLEHTYSGFKWQHPVLIGHSNGGDISAWMARAYPSFASVVVTLDSRRVTLPRGISPRVLTIRASDFQADVGVLPNITEQIKFASCIVTIPGAKHNDMHDDGSSELKGKIADAIVAFLEENTCINGND